MSVQDAGDKGLKGFSCLGLGVYGFDLSKVCGWHSQE